NHPAGGFGTLDTRVHNRGYGSLRARLSLSGGAITGGAARFSIVGGFSPALIAGVGRSFTVAFDDNGATPDSTFNATLTLPTPDEPPPRALSQPPPPLPP